MVHRQLLFLVQPRRGIYVLTSSTDGNYELEHFDHFVCRILATYADESVLNDKDKIDYHVFKPVLFEFPTYEYFITGDRIGNCGKMSQ